MPSRFCLSMILLAGLPGSLLSAQTPAPDTSLAMARPETAAKARLIVGSPSFRPGGALPARFSAYKEGVSPAIHWSGAPSSTKSFVLLMEDREQVLAAMKGHVVARGEVVATFAQATKPTEP